MQPGAAGQNFRRLLLMPTLFAVWVLAALPAAIVAFLIALMLTLPARFKAPSPLWLSVGLVGSGVVFVAWVLRVLGAGLARPVLVGTAVLGLGLRAAAALWENVPMTLSSGLIFGALALVGTLHLLAHAALWIGKRASASAGLTAVTLLLSAGALGGAGMSAGPARQLVHEQEQSISSFGIPKSLDPVSIPNSFEPFDAPDAMGRCLQTFTDAPGLLARARRAAGDSLWADEIIRDVMLTVCNRIASGPSLMDPEGYLLRAIMNRRLCVARRECIVGLCETDELPDPVCTVTPEAEYASKESIDLMRSFICDLPHDQRQVLEMQLQGRSHAEIAEALGVSAATVRQRASRGLKRLKELWAERCN